MKIKSILAAAMALTMVFGSGANILPFKTFDTAISASAFEFGDFEYSVNEDHVEITKYNGSDKEVKIPAEIDGMSVKGIYSGAFTGCENLKRVIIPGSVTTIADNSFDSGVTIICKKGSAAQSYAAFNSLKCEYFSTGYEDYVYKDLDEETIKITEYLGNGEEITIPSEIGEKKVSTIGAAAFSGSASIKSVTIPDGVTKIADNAFYGCKDLTSVTIPASVTDIGRWAFGYYYDYEELENKKVDGFKIKCYKDTAGEKYAKDNGFEYELLDEPDDSSSTPDSSEPDSSSTPDSSEPDSSSTPDSSEPDSSSTPDSSEPDSSSTPDSSVPDSSSTPDTSDPDSSSPDKPKFLKGDVNGDGKIDIEDAVMVINHVNGQKALTDEEIERANVDGNSKIDIEDAVSIIAHVNGVKKIN